MLRDETLVGSLAVGALAGIRRAVSHRVSRRGRPLARFVGGHERVSISTGSRAIGWDGTAEFIGRNAPRMLTRHGRVDFLYFSALIAVEGRRPQC